MRRRLLFNYLYICTLSILCQSPNCLTQTENPIARSSGSLISSKEDRAVELEQNEAGLSADSSHTIQRRQVIVEKTRDDVHQARRKRELRDASKPSQLRTSSNPFNKAELNSGEQRVKKSDHPINGSSMKLSSIKNSAKINSMGNQGGLVNEDKRGLHKQRDSASRSSISIDENEPKSEQKETKRSSNKAAEVTKPKSRAIKVSDLSPQTSFSKDKQRIGHEWKSTALEDAVKVQKLESDDEQVDDEDDIDDNSAAEYEETGEEDDSENNPEISRNEEESEKVNLSEGAGEDDDFSSQEMAKREADVAEEEYEDIEDQDGVCKEDGVADESSYQQAKIQPEAGLLEKQETDESRVKRHNIETKGNDALQLSDEHLDEVKEDPEDNLKREVPPLFSKSSLQYETENSRRQAASGNVNKNETSGQADPQVKNGTKSTNETQIDSNNKNNTSSEKSDARFNRDTNKSVEFESELRVAPDIKSDVDENGQSSRQESNLDLTSKDDELDLDERKLELQIQQRIDSIKDEIKREVEEKQKIQEIEENNAKYDEMQNQIEEDEDEDNQSLDIPSERKTISKRSTIDGIRTPVIKSKRGILRRVKRSETTDARQLRAIEGVEKLSPDVLIKSQLCHESIRKRSAPIYGAADKDVPEISGPLIEKDVPFRRVYLASNGRKRSLSPRKREDGNAIIIPEHAHVNIEDEVPPGLSLDPNLLEDSSSSRTNNRLKRSPERFARRRRASALIPEGRVAFLGYRPQEDDENDEGSEFDDDGFEDRTSNLQQEKSYDSSQVQYQADESRDENPANFLFSGVYNDRNDYLVRRKRAGFQNDEQSVGLHGGGALSRRQIRTRAEQMKTAKMRIKKNVIDRDERQTENVVHDRKANSVSLVEGSQELSPRLATEYREAFGGMQGDPGGGFARFKRVKRDTLRIL